jgi:hypothetical protein
MGLQTNAARGFLCKLWGFEVKTDGVLPVTAVTVTATNLSFCYTNGFMDAIT